MALAFAGAMLFGILLGTSECKATEYTVGSILASIHYVDADYNEQQFPSLYFARDGLTVGFYRHSYAHLVPGNGIEDYAFFVGQQFEHARRKNWGFNSFVGVVTNYPHRSEMVEDLGDGRFPYSDTYLWLGLSFRYGNARISVLPFGKLSAFAIEQSWRKP